jgi:hypothetical protein
MVNGRSTLLAANDPTITPTPVKTATPTSSPTLVPSTPTPTIEPTEEGIAAELETAVPTQSPTATIEPTTVTNASATLLLNSSLFAEPNPEAAELAVLETGDGVNIIGRSEVGNWFYVLNDDTIAGYVFSERIAWAGDFDALPTVPSNPNQPSASTSTCAKNNCPALSIDLYALPGNRCEGDVAYRTIYMRGQGGNGRYTYYWNNEKLIGPINKGHGFDVNNLNGDPVIGTGKVVSEDGQVVEKKLFVTDFGCGD